MKDQAKVLERGKLKLRKEKNLDLSFLYGSMSLKASLTEIHFCNYVGVRIV